MFRLDINHFNWSCTLFNRLPKIHRAFGKLKMSLMI